AGRSRGVTAPAPERAQCGRAHAGADHGRNCPRLRRAPQCAERWQLHPEFIVGQQGAAGDVRGRAAAHLARRTTARVPDAFAEPALLCEDARRHTGHPEFLRLRHGQEVTIHGAGGRAGRSSCSQARILSRRVFVWASNDGNVATIDVSGAACERNVARPCRTVRRNGRSATTSRACGRNQRAWPATCSIRSLDGASQPSPGVEREQSVLNPRVAAFAALLVAAAAAPTTSVAHSGPDVSHFTLANGLELVVIPDHRTPVVTHMIWYKVGSADETPGKSGLAHFLEHLMFKGTAKHPIGQFSHKVSTIGGQENAFTSTDYTGYFQRTSREYLPTLMEFEADRMTGLVLSDDVVKPELQVVLEEQNMRVANNPAARLGEQVVAALYLNHPYGRPVIGWRPEIEKLNAE